MSDSFSFKQFEIHHDRCAMKVGTDGVLLGAWADVRGVHTILDVGTGSGLIAIMLAQRNQSAVVHGIDIDGEAVMQAQANMAACPWHDRLTASVADFADMTQPDCGFDLIVSNPPFYAEDTACPDDRRNAARHTSSLPIEVLVTRAAEMMSATGRMAMIIPSTLIARCVSSASSVGLYLLRRTDVHTTPRKAPKRVLVELGREAQPVDSSTLCIRDTEGQFTESYIALTRDFYL